jgi:hypothetical protein
MSTREDKLKVRMIRTPSYEDESVFIVLDAFQPYDSIFHSYLIGCKLYMQKPMVERSRRGEEVLHPILRERRYDGINRSKEDVFEIPTIREYTRFMELLQKEGYVWNKKKGTLTKDGRLVT